ncbi:MAG TPA: hypothetical protein VLA71_17090, partial [Algoriphagus sp.]|nr:hypothetical protein [Algoriphagus sp.]
MRQGTELSIPVFLQKPDHGRDKIDRGFHKKVPLVFDPFPVQSKHDSPGSKVDAKGKFPVPASR